MSVEIVILVPALLLILMLIVAMGRFVTAQGDVRAATREAVRAATLERDPAAAARAARDAAEAALPESADCGPATLSGNFVAGATITVSLDCSVSWAGLAPIGLTGSTTINEQSSAPLDRYRRTGGP
ncbi:TadE/TadG family type IV pilus assembly protein [Cellulomonas rhizosphaerae]|uniref:Pilus assembly protein n=1 Tax=Cellulomonas rhizosphaerae TaxID=2293719 RepID=A0A413RPD0_9CELL|nr:TadE family protein [Cellulomonas rhizosphaerae]RHA43827.1 pilus assembly protein [Cellulomonas rhizosphaerae]